MKNDHRRVNDEQGYIENSFTISTATSATLVDFFVVGLVAYLVQDRLRAVSLEKQSRGLELANYILIFIFVVVDIAAEIMIVNVVEKQAVCDACFYYDSCGLSCDDSLKSLYNNSNIMYIVLKALYAIAGGYWLVLAIVALKRGKRMNSACSVCNLPGLYGPLGKLKGKAN
jgi:hypothetical protein